MKWSKSIIKTKSFITLNSACCGSCFSVISNLIGLSELSGGAVFPQKHWPPCSRPILKCPKIFAVTCSDQSNAKQREILVFFRVAEVVWRQEGPSPKSLDLNENFKPKHTLFCRELRFVAIYTLFGDLWAKKVTFWVKNSVSWARSALLHGIYCIFHWVNFANLTH